MKSKMKANFRVDDREVTRDVAEQFMIDDARMRACMTVEAIKVYRIVLTDGHVLFSLIKEGKDEDEAYQLLHDSIPTGFKIEQVYRATPPQWN